MFANKKAGIIIPKKIVEKRDFHVIVISVLHLCDMFYLHRQYIMAFFVLKAGILTLGME